MTTSISSRLASNLMQGITLPTMLDGGVIAIYSGALPPDPNAPTGVLLGTVLTPTLDFPAWVLEGAQALLDPALTWKVVPTAVGVPGYILVTGSPGYSDCRIATDQHTVPPITSLEANIEVNFSSINLSGS